MLLAHLVLAAAAAGSGPASAPPSKPEPMAIVVTALKVGGIRAETKPTVAKLKKLFPGCEVTSKEDMSEGEVTGTRLSIPCAGLTVHATLSGELFSVEVVNPNAQTMHMLKLGDKLSALASQGKIRCAPGLEEAAGWSFVVLESAPTISYGVQHLPGESDGSCPEEKALLERKIEKVVWHPK